MYTALKSGIQIAIRCQFAMSVLNALSVFCIRKRSEWACQLNIFLNPEIKINAGVDSRLYWKMSKILLLIEKRGEDVVRMQRRQRASGRY